MKRITSICLTILLIIGVPLLSFAQDSNDYIKITGDNEDIFWDDSEIMEAIANISDPVKKELLIEFCFKPLYCEVKTYSSRESYSDRINDISMQRDVTIGKIIALSECTVDEIRVEFDRMIVDCINKVIESNNRYISIELYQYIEEKKPEYISALNNKIMDESIVFTIAIDDYNDGAAINEDAAVVYKYYSKSLEMLAGIGVYAIGTCEVNWTYDNDTKRIQSLYPSTTFINAMGSVYVFTSWEKNEQPLSDDKTRGYVQKSRYIEAIGQGVSVKTNKMVWNLVFSPNASNTNRTLYEQVALMNPVTIINWGGGY